jgi:D-serine deaminase-like pyridoxal phosphate-dependent protein
MAPASSTVAIGDRIRIVPNHVCSTTNLGRRYHALRGDVVTEVIPIDAAGGVH